jgi:Tol biopolymer transport system component
MALAAGTKLGPYEILAPIGAGGMGEVYRARDTKLDREVAIKILPEALAQNPDRLARLEREAKVLAALNHPNIAQIYGVEQGALVMELVEGEMLSGPVPLVTALDYARQIADGMEAAHEKGIVHRDLKPANIKTTPQGVIKILDFGLAAVMQPAGPRADASISPTLTLAATQMGVLMGTAGYMSPEQAAGKPVDKRADIWAFGAVVWELLTGRRLFEGETISHTLAAVLTKELDWTLLPNSVPLGVRKLLKRCLTRDLRQRLPDIGAARLELEEAMVGGSATEVPSQAQQLPHKKLPWILAAAGTLTAMVLGAIVWHAARPADRSLIRLSIDLGPGALTGNSLSVAISPNGNRIAYTVEGSGGRRQLATRLLEQATPSILSGTEEAQRPFFSPDGQWIGFFADGKLKKVSVQGGAVITLCDAPDGRGAAWGLDGAIIATLNPGVGAGLSRIPDSGGTPQVLSRPAQGETTHRWPQILPGGRAVLFTGNRIVGNKFDEANIEVLSLRTGQAKVVVRGGYYGRYLPNGYLVYLREGTLFGLPFDADGLQVRGAPSPVLEEVAGNSSIGDGQFDFSQTGAMIYLSGKLASEVHPILSLDRTSKTQPLLPIGRYANLSFAPDGKRLAFNDENRDLQIYDRGRDATTRLTFTGKQSTFPVWAPNGKHIAFVSDVTSLEWIRSDGGGEPQSLLEGSSQPRPYSFSPDGKRLAYSGASPETGSDLWTLPLDVSDPERPKPGKPEPFLRTRFDEMQPAFSPDGRWIAYSSNESGSYQIYVRPFAAGGPAGAGKWQISTGTGRRPIWSRVSRELIYETLDNHIMIAAYTATGDSFVAEKPRLWSNTQVQELGGSAWNLDLAPDGNSLAFLPATDPADDRENLLRATFLLNFFDEVRRRIPEAK